MADRAKIVVSVNCMLGILSNDCGSSGDEHSASAVLVGVGRFIPESLGLELDGGLGPGI